MNTELESLKDAIDIAGNQAKLAKLIGKSQGHITVWLNRDERVPADMAVPIEGVTGVSKHRLRPDIFGKPSETATA